MTTPSWSGSVSILSERWTSLLSESGSCKVRLGKSSISTNQNMEHPTQNTWQPIFLFIHNLTILGTLNNIITYPISRNIPPEQILFTASKRTTKRLSRSCTIARISVRQSEYQNPKRYIKCSRKDWSRTINKRCAAQLSKYTTSLSSDINITSVLQSSNISYSSSSLSQSSFCGINLFQSIFWRLFLDSLFWRPLNAFWTLQRKMILVATTMAAREGLASTKLSSRLRWLLLLWFSLFLQTE